MASRVNAVKYNNTLQSCDGFYNVQMEVFYVFIKGFLLLFLNCIGIYLFIYIYYNILFIYYLYIIYIICIYIMYIYIIYNMYNILYIYYM